MKNSNIYILLVSAIGIILTWQFALRPGEGMWWVAMLALFTFAIALTTIGLERSTKCLP